MIEWIDASTKPGVNIDGAFDSFHKISPRVLVRMTEPTGKFKGYGLGTFNHISKMWHIENHTDDFFISHWSSLNEPETYDRYAVFEYNELASPLYVGSRYMSSWHKPITLKPKGKSILIAENVSVEEAHKLIEMGKKNVYEAFNDNLPDELKLDPDRIKNFLKESD